MAKRPTRPEVKLNLFDTVNGEILPDVLERIKQVEEAQKEYDSQAKEKKLTRSGPNAQESRVIDDPFSCTLCSLCKSKRNYVLPDGDKNADILLVGEAPGAEEDACGKPFVGSSGRLLIDALKEVGLTREQVCIANVCMCRPPSNRQPSKEEMSTCIPYLNWLIKSMPQLKVIILCGATALFAVLKLQKIMERRGSLIAYQGKSCIPTLHPAAILRNINLRPLLISDLQLAKQKASGTIDFGKYVCIDERSKLDSVFHRISEVEELSVDLETSVIGDDPDFVHDHMLGTSFSWQEKTGLYIPLWENHKKIWDPATETYILNSYRELLTDPSKKKLVMHNGKFDYKFLKKVGVDLSRCVIKDGEIRTPFYFDTMLAHHLIWERPPHDLKHLARRFPDLASYEGELDTYKKANKTTDYGDIPMHIMYKYAAGDADATLRLYKIFSAELEQDPVRNHLFHSLIMPFAVALAETEYNGTKIDRDTISYLRVQLERRIEKRKGLIFKRSGKEFNINSIDQLGAVLYDDLNLSKNPSKTPTGKRKVDDEALSEIKHKHKIVRSILNYRGAMKEYKTYVLGLEKGLDESNRIHPNFKQHGTETGRLSCTKPNLQNIPRGNKMRSLFTAEAGCSLVGADFSQIEIRVLAALTRDPDLLRVFNEGRDIHTEVAKRVLHKQEVTKEERIIAKGINFGIMYGRGANSIAEELGIDRSVAETFLREYLKMYPGISAFQAQQKSIVHREKQVKTMFGRIRHLPEIDSEFEDEIASAERQALNSPIQGTAADCANLSAVKIYFILREIGLDAKLVLTIHDELVFEVKNADVPKVASLVYSIMKETAEEALNVPVDVDLYVYPKWVEPKEAEQRRYLASIGCKETLLEDIKNGIQS